MKLNLHKIEKEMPMLEEVLYECMKFNSNGDGYLGISLGKLSNLYDKIENALIGFNMIAKDLSKIMGGNELICGEDGIEKFLESELLNLVVSATIRNPSHIIYKKFKESLWKQKLKDKAYYNQLCELSGIEDKVKDVFYGYMQKEM